MSQIEIGIDDIHAGHAILTGAAEYAPGLRERVIVRTPLLYADASSRQFGCYDRLKLESLQKTGSYKLPGAFNNLCHLDPTLRGKGS